MTKTNRNTRLTAAIIAAAAITTLTTTTANAQPATHTTTTAAAATLKPGSQGPAVKTLQTRLAAQRFWLGTPNGYYGHTTTQAVLAYQKATGLTRDGIAGPATQNLLAKGGVRLIPHTRTSGIEVNKKLQLLLITKAGVTTKIINTSTGSGQTYKTSTGTARAVTPVGSYRVQRQIKGWHTAPLGRLYAPKYFTGGYAVHGATSIPAYPASHGCVRVSVPAMDYLWTAGLAPIGTSVTIY